MPGKKREPAKKPRAKTGVTMETLIRNIVEATARTAGEEFLRKFVVALGDELRADLIFIGGVLPDRKFVDTVVFLDGGEFQENFQYPLAGSPCEAVVLENRICTVSSGLRERFPDHAEINRRGIESFIGIPFSGLDGVCKGVVVAMCRGPMDVDDVQASILEFFAGRVSAEIERVRSEENLRSNEALLSAIIDNLPHGLTVKQPDGRFMLVNKEFSRRYGVTQGELLGHTSEETFPQWSDAWQLSRDQETEVADKGGTVTRSLDRAYLDGSTHRLEIVKFPVLADTGELMGIGSLAVDVTERASIEKESLERERILRSYHKALDKIVASDAMASTDAAEAFALLTEVAAETLGVERVSVWRAAKNMEHLECLDLYLREGARHDSGTVLSLDEFPNYFRALQQVEVIDAHDAWSDPRTSDFTGEYLETFGITSMLDAVVHIGDQLKGVLCLEHVGDPREWTLEEQSLARSLAALTSLIMTRQEQLAAERERQSVENRFREVVNALPSSLSLKDRDRRYVFVNKVYERNYGVTAEEAYGRGIDELGLNSPSILAAIAEEDRQVLEEGKSFTSESTRIGRDGEERAALVSKFPIYDQSGQVEMVGTLWTDISDQKDIQRTLEDARARLRAITDNVPIMLCLKGLDGHYIEANKSFADWHEINVRDVPGMRASDLLTAERANVLEGYEKKVIETGEVVVHEGVSRLHHRPDGNPMIFRMIKFPVLDAEGVIMGVGTALLDITEQKMAQQALEDMQARLMAITDNVPIMLSLKDRNGVYQHSNSSFAEWHGCSAEELIGKTSRDLLPAEAVGRIENADREVLETGKVVVFETETVFGHKRSGVPVTLRQFKFPIRDSAGEVTGVGTAMVDITDERRSELALQAHLGKLEEMVAERTVELTEEIAERRRAELELRRSESTMRGILERSPVGIAIVAREPRRRLFVNRSFLELFGAKSEEELNAVAMSDTYVDQSQLERLSNLFDQTGGFDGIEVHRRRLDGALRWVLMHSRLVMFEGQRAALVWHYDITNRKEAEEALARQAESLELTVADRTRELRESEALLSSIIEHLPAAILIKDANRRVERANSMFKEWYGIDPKTLIGKDVVLNEDVQSAEENARRDTQELGVLESGLLLKREVERPFLDGRLHTINVTKFPIYDDDGKIVRIGSIGIDVSVEVEARKALQRHERLLRSLIDNLPVALIMNDEAGRYNLVNQTFCAWYDLEPEDVLGRDISEIADLMGIDPKDVDEQDKLVRSKGIGFDRETERVMADGSNHTVQIRKYPFRDETGEIAGVVSVSVDVTDLRQRERELSTLVENVPGAVFRSRINKDLSGEALFISEGIEEITGYSSEEVTRRINSGDMGLFHPSDMEHVNSTVEEVVSAGAPRETTFRLITADQEERWVFRRSRVVQEDADGWIVEGLLLDITGQRKAEEAIRESEARLQAITQNAPMLLNLKDKEGRFQFVNESFAQWVRHPADQLIGMSIQDLLSPEEAERVSQYEQKVLKSGVAMEFEMASMIPQGDGSRTLQFIKFPVRDDKGEMSGVGTAIMDVTDRKRADAALKESEARFRGLFENAPAGITIKTTGGRYLAMNKTFLEWKGWDLLDIVGRRAVDLFGPNFATIIDEEDNRAVQEGAPVMKETAITCADGRKLVATKITAPMVTPEGQVTGVCSFYVDVSEFREIEAQLQQAQKMEAIGRLAGGIAHDFNNLLGAMMGFNEFLIEDLAQGTPQHNFALRVARAGDRAKQLVSQILAFSRASHGEQAVVDLNTVGEEAVSLLTGSLPVTTRVVFHPSDERVAAMTNAGQMSQVLMNLGVNANDALHGVDGVINISVSRVPAGSDVLQASGSVIQTAPGDFLDIRQTGPQEWMLTAGAVEPSLDHVLVSVEDTGPGIPEPVLRRIFDPFFTTKEAGKGTGLGLAVVHGIVTAHHGAVHVRSRIGEGARFEIYLPCVDPEAERDTTDEVTEKIFGRGMVLVVDDERDVADMVSIGLERLGFEVGVCSGGEEALEVFRETPDLWRAVISDQIMPDMRGMELIKELKAIRSDIPCVLCTGYSETLTEETARANGADAFLQKPVGSSRLGRVLAELLGA